MVQELAERFKTFQSGDSVLISASGIEEWLVQFYASEIPVAVTALTHVRFWNRAAIVDALAAGIQQTHAQERRVQVLPLGGPTASGQHLAYYFDDVRRILPGVDIVVLEGAASIEAAVPLLLYEDNVGRGGQPSTVLQQWVGLPECEWTVREKHVDALSSSQLAALRSCPIGLLFITGSRKGLGEVERTISQLLSPPRFSSWIVSPTDLSCFQPASRVFGTHEDAMLAKAAFERAGRLALGHQATRWTPERIRDSLLGYGNCGQLTVFDYNTPVTTLTALWSRCTLPDSPWTPLFPRRKREH